MEVMFLLFGLIAGSTILSISSDDSSDEEELTDQAEVEPVNPDDLTSDPEDETEDLTLDPPADSGVDQPMIITGSSESEMIEGGSANDTIAALSGDDTIFGGEGDDVLDGRAAAEVEYFHGSYQWDDFSETGNDTLVGGDGNDTIGLSEHDVAFGGLGSDRFEVYHSSHLSESSLPIIEDFEPSSDTLSLILEIGPEIPDEAIGEYLGGGNFQLDLGATTVAAVDSVGVMVCVNGSPVVLLSGLEEFDASQVDLQVFIGSTN